MAFDTEKDLKSKYVRWKKVYILAKDVNTKRIFEIRAKNKFDLKKPYALVHPNSGS